jgi:hypothetical protein
MNVVGVKSAFNPRGKVVSVLRPNLDGCIFGIPRIEVSIAALGVIEWYTSVGELHGGVYDFFIVIFGYGNSILWCVDSEEFFGPVKVAA